MKAVFGFKRYLPSVFEKIQSEPSFFAIAPVEASIQVGHHLEALDYLLEAWCEAKGWNFHSLTEQIGFISPPNPFTEVNAAASKLMYYPRTQLAAIVEMLEQMTLPEFEQIGDEVFQTLQVHPRPETPSAFALNRRHLQETFTLVRTFFLEAHRTQDYVLLEVGFENP
ncbi:MAG: hypothetical protein AAGD05_09495 [Bacteroidota bacterium]